MDSGTVAEERVNDKKEWREGFVRGESFGYPVRTEWFDGEFSEE